MVDNAPLFELGGTCNMGARVRVASWVYPENVRSRPRAEAGR